MLMRRLITLLCLSGIVGYLGYAQKSGAWERVDEWFLDFLIANARERFEETSPDGQVVLIEIKEEDRAEYATWPPPPLDWQTLLKALRPYEPDMVVITTPLNWGRPTPDFAPALAEALLPFPSVILGVESELADQPTDQPAFQGDLKAVLPRFRQATGDVSLAPSLKTLITAPDPAVRGTSEMGLVSLRQVDGEWRLPYALRDRDTLIPTALAQALSRHSQSPYATGQRLRLGTGAGAHLQGGRFIPLTVTGEYTVRDQDKVPTLNALDLMAGELADLTSETDKDLLKKADVLVIGITRDEAIDPSTQLYARALNRALSLPKLRVLSQVQQWVIWGIAALAAFWIALNVKRSKTLKAGAAVIFVALILSLLAFQSQLLWCPPTTPVALVIAGILLGRFLKAEKPAIASVSEPEVPVTT